MHTRLIATIATSLGLFLAGEVPAQCGGTGNATLEIIAVDNQVVGSGSQIVVRVSGPPNTHVCFLCDSGEGPTTYPGIGTFCLDGGPNLVVFVVFIPSSGFIDIPVTLGPMDLGLLCCQWIGIDSAQNDQIVISNYVCFDIGAECEGGIKELTYVTSVDAPASLPTTITSGLRNKKATGDLIGQTSISFDPEAPPSFPISDDGVVFIEKVAVIAGGLEVVTRVVAPPDKKGKLKLGANTHFAVTAGNNVSEQTIHTSCSKPFGVGFTFGDYTITHLVPRL